MNSSPFDTGVPDETTRCEYTVTYADFAASMPAYRHASHKAAVSYWLAVWVIPVVSLCLAAALVIWMQSGALDSSLSNLLLGAVCIGIAAGLPARYLLGLRRAFRQRNVLAQGRPIFCEFDSSRLRFVVPQGTEIGYAWSSFTHFGDGPEVAVFIIQDAAFHTVPKRAMDEAGWNKLRTCIRPYAKVV